MKFKRHAQLEYGLKPIDLAPFINIIFLLLIFFILISTLVVQPGIKVKLPRAITSEIIQEESLAITITSEDVMYFNDSVTTIRELRKVLLKSRNKEQPILIKADRRASVGRIVDVWGLCRDLGLERISIATD